MPYDPATPLLGIYPKELKTVIWEDVKTPLSLLPNYLQQPKYGSNLTVHQQMDTEMPYILIYIYQYLPTKKDEILSFVTKCMNYSK